MFRAFFVTVDALVVLCDLRGALNQGRGVYRRPRVRVLNAHSRALVEQVPVPVFLPAPLDGSERIPAVVEELKSKVSADALDAELLSMTTVMPEEEPKAEGERPGRLGAVRRPRLRAARRQQRWSLG